MKKGFLILILGIILCAVGQSQYNADLSNAQAVDSTVEVVDYMNSPVQFIGVALFITGFIVIAKNDLKK